MRPVILAGLMCTACCLCGSDDANHPWKGIQTVQVVVHGDGVAQYNAEAIRSLIELEFRRSGVRCISAHESVGDGAMATVIADVDGLLVHETDDTVGGCVYHWSLSASVWAHRVVDGAGMVVLEEHHNIGFGTSSEFPAHFSSEFTQLADTMVNHWLRDNPR